MVVDTRDRALSTPGFRCATHMGCGIPGTEYDPYKEHVPHLLWLVKTDFPEHLEAFAGLCGVATINRLLDHRDTIPAFHAVLKLGARKNNILRNLYDDYRLGVQDQFASKVNLLAQQSWWHDEVLHRVRRPPVYYQFQSGDYRDRMPGLLDEKYETMHQYVLCRPDERAKTKRFLDMIDPRGILKWRAFAVCSLVECRALGRPERAFMGCVDLVREVGRYLLPPRVM